MASARAKGEAAVPPDDHTLPEGAAVPPPPPRRPACPVCGGALLEIRGKLQCSVCHTICETCCEGGPPS